MNEVKKYTPEEILRRARAEFDYIWERCNREQVDGGPPFSISEYAQLLETMLLNRFGEAGLPRTLPNSGGIAGLEAAEEWPDSFV